MKVVFNKIFNKIKRTIKSKNIVSAWNKVKKTITPRVSIKSDQILIFPSDLKTITGALGDDAMINATIDQFRKHYPEIKVHLLCRESATEIVKNKGFTPIRIPWMNLKDFPLFISNIYSQNNYTSIIILGADIMDGYYGIEHPIMALIAADIAVKYGVDATILGASFNDKPRRELITFFNNVDSRVHINMRDKTSFDRLLKFAKVNAMLVADVAFLLKPGTVPIAVTQWVEQQKQQKRILLGVNVHPMLIKGATSTDIEKLINSTAEALKLTVLEHTNVSFLLLPHDYRGESGDARCLKPIYEQLKQIKSMNCFYLEGEHPASNLKAITGLLDGVITGRMHLAIASLGMGIPVLSLTYQDKFEGLYRHFDLPKNLLLSIENFDDNKKLSEELISFINQLATLRQHVKSHKPKVIELAKKNFVTKYNVAGEE